MIAVVGSIQSRSWDGADGKKQYATDVVVDEAYFTGSKNETGTSQGGFDGGYASPKPADNSNSDLEAFGDMDFMSMDNGADDDLPF